MTDISTWEKNLADSIAIYGRGREFFRVLTYVAFYCSGVLRFHLVTRQRKFFSSDNGHHKLCLLFMLKTVV